MAKIYLTESSKRDEALRRYIRASMIRQGIKTTAQLAERIGMGRSTLAAKIENPNTLKLSELRLLFKVFKTDCPVDRATAMWLESTSELLPKQ